MCLQHWQPAEKRPNHGPPWAHHGSHTPTNAPCTICRLSLPVDEPLILSVDWCFLLYFLEILLLYYRQRVRERESQLLTPVGASADRHSRGNDCTRSWSIEKTIIGWLALSFQVSFVSSLSCREHIWISANPRAPSNKPVPTRNGLQPFGGSDKGKRAVSLQSCRVPRTSAPCHFTWEGGAAIAKGGSSSIDYA